MSEMARQAGVDLKRYMDVSELAAYLGISKWLVYKHIERRDIPFIPFGRLIRFDRLAIDRWAEHRTVRAAPRPRARRKTAWNQTGASNVVSAWVPAAAERSNARIAEVSAHGNL